MGRRCGLFVCWGWSSWRCHGNSLSSCRGDVVFILDVWVEVLGVLEGFGECLEVLEDREEDSCGEVV